MDNFTDGSGNFDEFCTNNLSSIINIKTLSNNHLIFFLEKYYLSL